MTKIYFQRKRQYDIQNAVKVDQKRKPNSALGDDGVRVKYFYRGDKNKRNELEFGHDGLKSGKVLMGVKSPPPCTATSIPHTHIHWLMDH